jgi:trans-aconitate 2-methyltransferase
MQWDPEQYVRYREERSRPFHELLQRVPVEGARHVVDLGCGPGPLTRVLADRWPQARVVGVDSSPEMVAAAAPLAEPDRLEFVEGDVTTWQPGQPVDVVVANAVLQWVPGHLDLLDRYAGWLAPGGGLAFQVPANFDAPSHVLLRDLRRSPRWRERLGAAADRSGAVEPPERYLSALVAAGLEPDVWQTSYLHLLQGPDAVLEWVKGTAMRPVLSALDDDGRREVLEEYGAALREAYPQEEHGTVFPFLRTFCVGRRPR